MISIIYSEILKLKKSNTLFLILVGALVMPIFFDIALLIQGARNFHFSYYAYRSEGNNVMILSTMIFALLAGKVFSREYSDQTCATLFCYPYKRTQIFIGKLLVIYIMMIISYFIQGIYTYGSYFVFSDLGISIDEIIGNLKFTVVVLLFQMALIPIPVLFVNLKRSFVPASAYGIFASICIFTLTDSDKIINKFNPLLSTRFFVENYYRDGNFDFYSSVIGSSITFILFIILAIYQYKNAEIV